MSDTTKRWISGGFFSIFVLGIISIGLFGVQNPVYATDTEAIFAGGEAAAGAAEGSCLTAGATPAVCPATGIKESLNVVGGKIVSPAFRIALIQALLNLSQFVLNRLAYEAAVAIASGGPGEESLFYQQEPAEAFAQLGLEVAGEAVGMLSELTTEELGIEFNLCAPSSDLLNLALAIGIKQKYQQYQPTAPKCDILEVGKNWSGMFANLKQTFTDPDAINDAILSKFAESLKPGKNELSATLRINIAIDQKIHEQQLLQFLQQNEREYRPVTDFITGNVKTPSETLQGDFESKLKEVNGDQSKIQVGELVNAGELIGGLALSTASTFTNTLLSQLMGRIYTGLFETDPLPDPFDLEAVGGGDKSSAQQRFASIIATNPIATAEYNALSEFVVCTAEGVTNRGLNNCVMDVNFLAAVSRGNAGTAITVQEAIDEGLLNGDWPLISPENEPANQDPFCYTYGYCYGNVVKLRKARVLPIGWELAALRNSEGNPATLQEVIDGFNDCTEDGTIGPSGASDSSSKWCHLIDPNWVLKYPDSQCRAIANGEVRLSTLSPGRNSTCVDAPSCIGEDNDGNCVDGYGYCVQEKNVWRFRGDECPEEYATCLSFQNTETGDAGDFLVNTVDYSVCDDDNAGCRWYRTSKYYEDGGTADDTTDDSYEWLPEGDTYTTAERDNDWNYQDGGVSVSRETYFYTSDSGETYSYTSYAYEDRLYLTHNATECSDSSAGCTRLYEFDTDVYLNGVQNPSFEDDEDSDGVPDGWNRRHSTALLTTGTAQYGSTSVKLPRNAVVQLEQFVDVSEYNFYTFSAFFKAVSDGGQGIVHLTFLDSDGNEVDASGTSSSGDCTWNATSLSYELLPAPSADEFEQVSCLFTTPRDVVQVQMRIGGYWLSSVSDGVYVDAVQLELGEDANIFAEGYSTTPVAVYYKIAPDYLGCTGGANDPAECDGYAQVCSAQDVGCNLYAPEDGDPSVPAIISELDQCPSECVGYTTYKQEATDYESEDFPLYFIATSASSCSAQYVGCDSYTNLASVEAGGEGTEYYTNLRSCLTEAIADGDSGQVPSTYFTWEGSDNEGYQLQTWYLLESNYEDSASTFTNSGYVESLPELAPCTHISMTSENEVVCDEASESDLIDDVWNNETCDEHDDIFDNPDCREFFDTEGTIHYRQYSDTISISDACTPYRKDSGEETDCEDSGGYWTEQGFCRYYVLSEESTECPAEQNGCREYTGGAGRNASTILTDTFEGGTYEDFAIADTDANESSLTASGFITSGSAPYSVSISNESVATEGHSLYVLGNAGEINGIETVQISNGATYDADTASTCSGTVSDAGCDLTTDNDGDGSDDESCTVSDGSDSCGTLAGSLVAGKTFMLDFWAKGNGNLYVTFEEEGGSGDAHDFVNPTAEVTTFSDLTPVALDGSWALYSLGPLDTSSYDAFDETAVLRFAISAGGEFYIDNITLKQVEENLTLIKDSWVVPSTCDQTPGGVDSDQYYLGCEAYTDQNGNDVDLYQFSDLCSEEVVGCEGFFDTGNSDSAYQQVFNARCVYSTDASYDLTDGEVVGSNTACIVNDITYCTISTGRSYCTFDAETVFESPLPIDTSGTADFAIVYGPETAVVAGDTPVYIVANDAFACTSSVMGCQEVGEPTYNQDQSEVESFESVYYINLPGDYDNILCEHEALFCEEWSSTQDGNFYFKDPLDKSCEYKSTVTIENQSYFGWFRTGTTEPCYWEDKNGDGEYTRADDEAYLVAGEEFSVWRNGDEDDEDDDLWDYYDGWVASCDGKYDLCTEFIDVVDTGGGLNDYGQSYYFTNDELLSEDNLTDNQRCNGQVSQKFGCALFNNTTNSELTYNTSASYVTAVHADVIYGTEENDLVDPISCTTEEGGVFTVSESSAELIGLSGRTLDVCARRCLYEVGDGDSITTDLAQQVEDVDTAFLERSCLFDTDCPTLTSYLGEDVSGSCGNTDQTLTDLGSSEDADDYYLVDDANEVIKVNRDRTCSAWLACESSRTSWNTSTNMYDTICESIDLCVEGSFQGDSVICTNWTEVDPIIISDFEYSSRDVSWTGSEYSGFSIPNQLPVQYYDQFNVNPERRCEYTTGNGLTNDNDEDVVCSSTEDCDTYNISGTCTLDSECTDLGYGGCEEDTGDCFYACNEVVQDYRLVYNAGPCDSSEGVGVGQGGDCTVGHCEDSGDSCSADDDCVTGESCIVGYLQATATQDCGNDDCSCNPDNNDSDNDNINSSCSGATSSAGISTEVCDPVQFVCVDELTSDIENRDACVTDSSSRTCVPTNTSIAGTCYNDRCLALIGDFDGDGAHTPDPFSRSKAREESCRAYPEVDSPYSSDVVTEWATYPDDGAGLPDYSDYSEDISSSSTNLEIWSHPYSYVSGYQDSLVCSPNEEGEISDNCICSYDKVEYGTGQYYRYIAPNSGNSADSLSSSTVTYDEVPDAVCVDGPFKGAPCETNNDCPTNSSLGVGTCERVTKQDTYYGWHGYCLEKDTSIQINGSSDTEDRACLTWLPVDQLSGGTDLYGKYTQAGYKLEDTYYCAEVTLAYDIQTSSTMCAESQGSCPDGSGWSDFIDDIEADGSCIGAVTCPNGYFAVMTGCGDLSHDESGSSTTDIDDDSPFCAEISGDSDCPFFCVPKGSYKTEDDEIDGINSDVGMPCLPPGVEADDSANNNPFNRPSNKKWTYSQIAGWGEREVTHSAGFDFTIYLVYDIDPDDANVSWPDVKEWYNDCTVRGVTDSLLDFIAPYEEVGQLPLFGTVGSKGYRAPSNGTINWNFGGYPACETLVQVASQDASNEGDYNTAWTDRDWYDSGEERYTLRGAIYDNFEFSTLSEIMPFGATINYSELQGESDPWPLQVLACSDASDGSYYQAGEVVDQIYSYAVPESDLSCSVTDYVISSSSGEQAKSFTNFQLVEGFTSSSENWPTTCGGSTGGDCTLTCSTTADPEDECNQGLFCDDSDSDSDNWVCIGDGPLLGNSCSNDSDCRPLTCVENGEISTSSGSDTRISTRRCGLETPGYSLITGSDTVSISLLKQMFARSYDIIQFSDGYTGIGGNDSSPSDEWGNRGSFCRRSEYTSPADCTDADAGAWIWDYRATGDGYESPTPPTVVSIGDCVDTTCFEGDDDEVTANEQSTGDIYGDGEKRVSLAFFAYADEDQMPLRRVIVDWGAGKDFGSSGPAWPADSQRGSPATDNFYKNQRGLNPISIQHETECDESEWGKTSDSCSTSYIQFVNNYTCTEGFLSSLSDRSCTIDEFGNLETSPCTGGVISGGDGACVFQPRVHARDNWGWCTGFCDAGLDGEDECYDGSDEGGDNECDYVNCPGGDSCSAGSTETIDPWVYYDGYIIIQPD